jgi:hypothetical protein
MARRIMPTRASHLDTSAAIEEAKWTAGGSGR